jgi:inorganic pyrophosphatase
MASAFLDGVPTFEADGRTLNMLIETPRGSRGKFKFDEATGLYQLHKLLPFGFFFPFHFGFIPHTRGEDGDPLDILLLLDMDIPQGSLVHARRPS